jgi:hypothetical protein
MAETFGVIAGASQLAMTCLSLIDLMKKIKGGPSALQNYQQKLEEVRNLSEAISENPLLQIPEVEVYTFALLSVVHNNGLKDILDKPRFLQSISFLHRQRQLSEAFQAIEREKSSLALVIHNQQARALHQMQSNMNRVNSQKNVKEESDHGSDLVESQVTALVPKSYHIDNASGNQFENKSEESQSQGQSLHGNMSRDDFSFFYDIYKNNPGASIYANNRVYNREKDGAGGGAAVQQRNGHYFVGEIRSDNDQVRYDDDDDEILGDGGMHDDGMHNDGMHDDGTHDEGTHDDGTHDDDVPDNSEVHDNSGAHDDSKMPNISPAFHFQNYAGPRTIQRNGNFFAYDENFKFTADHLQTTGLYLGGTCDSGQQINGHTTRVIRRSRNTNDSKPMSGIDEQHKKRGTRVNK